MDLDVTSVMAETHKIVARAATLGEWIVIVCPDFAIAKVCNHAVACSLPPGAAYSGRTARIGAGKVSVVTARDEVFVPDNEPYSVAYIGWKVKDPGGLSKWQSRASHVIVP